VAEAIHPWRMPSPAIAVRLFVTAWLVYIVHFAPNIVREIYPAVALGDDFSFRVDAFGGMHPDLFETPGYGWHIGNNPGVSMVAAVPYAIFRPITDRIVQAVQERRAATGADAPPAYDSPWPLAREFYAQAWERGMDVKLGLAALVMQVFCMAPSSALAVVVMFLLLRMLFRSDRIATWLALLYAFGTPVFFRTGFLNHNLMLGHIAFFGFVAMWNPQSHVPGSTRARYLFAGFTGGTAVLFDYSGIVLLLGLFGYAVVRGRQEGGNREAVRRGIWYVAGSLVPLALLLFYQWRSFGSPIYPGQHWMPEVEWSDQGYRGYGPPQLELLLALAFDYRFGLFTTAPLLLLGVLYPLARRGDPPALPTRELVFMMLLFAGLWIFFAGSNYTRLQYNTGLRYMAPAIPFLFVPAVALLVRMRRWAVISVALLSVTMSWCLAMYRDVESGLGVARPVVSTLLGGFQLPALISLSYARDQFGSLFPSGTSPLPIFALTAVIIWVIWSGPTRDPSHLGPVGRGRRQRDT
jgi:hypothetical protein